MSILPLEDAIPRFKANEDRVNDFTNGDTTKVWLTSEGIALPSIAKFLYDKELEIDNANFGVMTQAVAAAATATTKAAEASASATAAAASAAQANGNSATDLAVIEDADTFLTREASAGGELKKFSWLNLKNTLKSFFDPMYLASSGGVVTGDITIDEETGGAVFGMKAPAGQLKIARFYTDDSLRWQMGTTNTAESGANAGTNFAISAYADNAASLGNALTINRASRVVDFPIRPTFNGQALATQAEAAAGGGGSGVTSWMGRTGAVDSLPGDYSSTDITHGGNNVSNWLEYLNRKTPWFVPEEYGAIGDGVVDDSNAFDAMMAALPADGPSLIILSKRYYLSRQWHINKRGVKVIGVGPMDYHSSYGTAIIFKNNNFDGIMIGSNVDNTILYGFELSNFQVIMNTCTDSTRFAMVVAGAAHVKLERLRLLGSSNNSSGQCNGLWFRDGQSLNMDQVYIIGFTAEYCFFQSAALQINNPGGDQRWIYGGRRPDVVIAVGCRFAGADGNTRTEAVRIGGAAVGLGSSMFRDCTTVFCKHHYVMEKQSGDTSTGIPSFCYIMGKGGEAASADYIRLVHGYHFMMNGAYFGTADDSGSGGSGLVVEPTFGGPVIVNGCYIKATAKHVVHVKGSRDITLVGNTFGRAGVGSSQVYSNIRVEAEAAEVLINGNNFTNLVPSTAEPYNNTRYGIDCVSNDQILITNNRARGGLGDIRYKTGPNVVVANNLGALTSF